MVTEAPKPSPTAPSRSDVGGDLPHEIKKPEVQPVPTDGVRGDLTQVGFLALLRPPRNKLNRPPASCPP